MGLVGSGRLDSSPVGATQITTVTGESYVVDGTPQEVEAVIIAAARGSIMQFAWLTDAASAEPVALNPTYLVALRPVQAPVDSR